MAYTELKTSSLQARLLLSGTTAVALMMVAPLAQAQAPGEDISDEFTQPIEEDEIVVTGIRNALKEARDLKRDADTAIDSITASDVSALPDLSVAEALARIPGVVVQRVALNERNGGDFPSPEGGGNLVRGLQLVRSELNSREAFSANAGRALDFGTIPPELIGAVDVYKNATADLVEGGIGGTINLRTLEPFDRNGQFAVATADAVYTDLREAVTPELSLVVGNQWDLANGGRLGLLGSTSYSELKSDLNGFQIGQLNPIEIDGVNVAIPGGFQLRTNEVDRDRDSFYLAGQYEDSEGNFRATAKYTRVTNRQEGDERTLEWFSSGESFNQYEFPNGITTRPFSSSGLPLCNGSGAPNGDPLFCEQTLPVTAIYESGLISNNLRDWTGSQGAEYSTLSINQVDESTVDDISLNLKFRPADNVFVNLDGHVTTAESTRQRIWAGTKLFGDLELNPDLDNPSVTLVQNENTNFNPAFVRGAEGGPSSGDFRDPGNNFFLFAADQFNDNEGDLYAISGDVEYDFENDGWFDSIKVGARFSERSQTNRQTNLNWSSVAAPWNGGYSGFDVNGASSELVDYSDFFRGGVVQGDNTDFLFVNSNLVGNYQALQAAVNTSENLGAPTPDRAAEFWVPFGSSFDNAFTTNRPDGAFGSRSTGDITEQTTAAFARADFAQEFGNGMSFDANIGVRYVRAEVDFDGISTFNPVAEDRLLTSEIFVAENPDTTLTPAQIDAFVAQTNSNRNVNFVPELLAFSTRDDIALQGQTDAEDYWLPSANLKVNLSDELLFRAGYSKNITRPRLGQLTPNQSFSFGVDRVVENPGVVLQPGEQQVVLGFVGTGNVSGGNPNLQAITSNNYDLSLEYYFGEENSLTATGFRKDIDNNIVYGSRLIGTETLDGVEVPIVFNGDLNQDEAELQGVEIAYQHFYDFLPGPLSNLGLQANYTYIDAEAAAPAPLVDANGDGQPDDFERVFRFNVEDFPGLSKHSANVVGIYQDEDWEFRLAYNWRSKYLSAYRDFVTGNPIFQDDRGYLDGSVKWDINDALQFRVQAANLLDTEAKALQQIDADGQFFGRTNFIQDRRIKVGFRYAFN